MSIEDTKTVINDVRTAYLIMKNDNYKQRLFEAYNYLKSEGVESLEDFTTREGLKVGAFTYDEITIFDRIKNEEYKREIFAAFDTITSLTIEHAKDPNYGDELASWGTLGETPYRDDLIDKGYIIEGLTEEEANKRFR